MPNKYHAKSRVVDGYRFDSMAEADYYVGLKMCQENGEISGLIVHPRYELSEAFYHEGKRERPIFYEADFQYNENGNTLVVDVKGMRTDVYKLKRKLFLSKYGQLFKFIEIGV